MKSEGSEFQIYGLSFSTRFGIFIFLLTELARGLLGRTGMLENANGSMFSSLPDTAGTELWEERPWIFKCLKKIPFMIGQFSFGKWFILFYRMISPNLYFVDILLMCQPTAGKMGTAFSTLEK